MNNYEVPDFRQLVSDLIDLNWTQQQIADEIGVSQPTISRLLHGVRVDPPISVAFPLYHLHKHQMTLAKRRENRKVA